MFVEDTEGFLHNAWRDAHEACVVVVVVVARGTEKRPIIPAQGSGLSASCSSPIKGNPCWSFRCIKYTIAISSC